MYRGINTFSHYYYYYNFSL